MLIISNNEKITSLLHSYLEKLNKMITKCDKCLDKYDKLSQCLSDYELIQEMIELNKILL